MNYIITEEQNQRLEEIILKFFDKNLTPFEGWESHEDYKQELDDSSGELFFILSDTADWDINRDNHMWYSVCNNDNLSGPLPEDECPVVTLPPPVFDALNSYFGDNWKKLFRRWFIRHTGLLVIQIDSL